MSEKEEVWKLYHFLMSTTNWHLTRAFDSNFPCSSLGKKSACSAGDLGSIPGLGRSPGEGNGNPLQYPCLENLMERGAWWAAVHGGAESGMTEWLTHTWPTTRAFAICLCRDWTLCCYGFWPSAASKGNSGWRWSQSLHLFIYGKTGKFLHGDISS